MGEAKPTPGEWAFRDNEGWTLAIDGVSVMGNAEYYPWVPQNKADWLLFADAGNTYNTTGLTPSQLVERVEELEGAAKLVLDWYEAENDHSKTDFYQRVQMCRDSEDAIRAALSKARPNTAEGEAVEKVESPQVLAYSIDADQHGIRARVAEAITGALAFGAQGDNPPPPGHWLEPFWNAANSDRASALCKLIEQMRDALETCTLGDTSTGHVIYPSFDEQKVSDALEACDELSAARKQAAAKEPSP